MATLITVGEVLQASPESSRFPAALIAPHIQRKEDSLARTCLGRDFYDALLADKIDWGVVQTWKATESYSLDQYVDFYGMTLKSLANSNTTNPCEDDGTKWEAAEKFDTACYNTLWTTYLRPYLAFVVMASALDYATNPAGAKGVVEWSDESGARSASTAVLQGRKRKILEDANELLDNMKDWMIRLNATGETCEGLFSDVPSVAAACGTACAPTYLRRRFAFRPKGYFDGYYQ